MTQTQHFIFDVPDVGTDLSETERYRLLAPDRRRLVLDVLQRQGPAMDLSDLAEAVATHEADDGEPSPRAVEDVAISLHHNHLPALAHGEVVDYRPESNRVEY
jgi:hypothetical protein